MFTRRVTILFLIALMLAACGGAPPVAQSPTAPPAPTNAPAPTAAPAPPTAVTPQRSTLAPPPTVPPEPTDAPAPTDVPEPTGAPLVESSPTEALDPTAIPQPTAPAATQASQPTAAPAATRASQPTAASKPTAAPQPDATFGSELLFLRKGALIAFDIGTRKERQLATSVIDFAAAPAGTQIVLVRDLGKGDINNSGIDLWSVQRDGSNLTRLTKDGYDLIEATPAWSPDGLAIVYAAAATSDPYPRGWPEWSLWCTASAIHVLDLQSNTSQAFGPGCDPAFSPDGKRIAYAAPPTMSDPTIDNGPTIVNAIRLINRQGQNGWNFAKADGPDAASPHTGRVVYAPAWSPDSQQVVYQRFLGYQALVDLDLTEIAGSFAGNGKPLAAGAGWLLPARFTPDGQTLAITENNAGDARGFGGYDNWSVTIIGLGGTHEIVLPSGTIQAVGQLVDRLPRGQVAAWSPDGVALAVELPPGWNAELPPNQPVNADGQPGEIWRWKPGSAPEELLVKNVDFASPLVWLR